MKVLKSNKISKIKITCLTIDQGKDDTITYTQRESEGGTDDHETNRDNGEEAQNKLGPSYNNVGQDKVLLVLKYGTSKSINKGVSFDIGFEPLRNGKKKPVLSSERRVKKPKSENEKDDAELRIATYHVQKIIQICQTQAEENSLNLAKPREAAWLGFLRYNARYDTFEHVTTISPSYVDNTPHCSSCKRTSY